MRLLTPRGRKREKAEGFVASGLSRELSKPPLSADTEWSRTCLGEAAHPAFWGGAAKHSCWQHQSLQVFSQRVLDTCRQRSLSGELSPGLVPGRKTGHGACLQPTLPTRVSGGSFWSGTGLPSTRRGCCLASRWVWPSSRYRQPAV